MQSYSIWCCLPDSISPSLASANYLRFSIFSTRSRDNALFAGFPRSSKLPLTCSQPALNSADELELEKKSLAWGFVETGYISSVHGLQGEVRVKPSTDFPDLRFSKPGLRWLRQRVSGTETLQEIELLKGRGNPGQSWILKFNEINSVEQAQKLVGSTLLVTDADRPMLEEGEFYTHDLIGMRVVLKESGEPVGTVEKVINSGANDLLHVRLNMSKNMPGHFGKSKVGEQDSGPLIWIPFVEEIVPVVDLDEREMLITPPKGLLELNIRTHERSKKERRELEWKERKKFQRRLIAAKKKLCEMEQQHVFDGFRYGQKDQTSFLANQIVTMNSNLLQQALQNIGTPTPRKNLPQVLCAVPKTNVIKISVNPLSTQVENLSDSFQKLQKEGNILASTGKFAMFLVLEENKEIKDSSDDDLVKELLGDPQRFIEISIRTLVPLVLVCPAHSVSSLQELFAMHDYFSFDPDKVWFLEDEKIPVVSSTLEGHRHKILMKSPWEFLQTPVGSGGFISLLSSQGLLDRLNEIGVEYIEVRSINQNNDFGCTLLGLVDSCKANIGVQLLRDDPHKEQYDMILSMSFIKSSVSQVNKLQFHAILRSNSYVEKVGKDWIHITPSAPNSYEFHYSIYGCLDASPPNKICILDSSV